MSILTLNCGSSSVKYAVYDEETGDFTCRGIVERVGERGARLRHRAGGEERTEERDCPDHHAGVRWVLDTLTGGDAPPVPDPAAIRAVGHRVVHGGERFARSALVTEALLATIEECARLAPLHNPPNLAGIRAARELLGDAAHAAVFDTAFHQTMEPAAYVYPLPYAWYERHGVRRYGFHGTSHLYVAHRAAALLGRPLGELRLITLHVGNGASAAAIVGGRSVDTSMGFTPLEGLVMGTRCGWIDPAVPLFVMQQEGMDAAAMDRVLNKQSGLLGITGRHTDRRDLLRDAEEDDQRCRLARDVEVRSLKKIIGAYAAVMGGLDCVVFTAGVGENAAVIRALALDGLGFLGIRLDPERNRQATGGHREEPVTADDSPVPVLVVPTNEELVIAEDTLALVEGRFERPDFRYSFS